MSYEPFHGDPNSTILRMTGVGLSPYATRGLSQTLNPIGASAVIRRTINGTLIDLSAEQFRKYESVISGTDQRVPSLDGIWPGRTVEVECIAELSYVTAEAAGPGREIVDGSSREEDTLTFYRPVLIMKVTNFEQNIDEYGVVIGWSLNLEEV